MKYIQTIIIIIILQNNFILLNNNSSVSEYELRLYIHKAIINRKLKNIAIQYHRIQNAEITQINVYNDQNIKFCLNSLFDFFNQLIKKIKGNKKAANI